MSNLVKRPWLFLPLLVLTLQSSWGQAPSGQVTFNFNSPTAAVYDFSAPNQNGGAYEFDQDIIGPGGTLTPLSLVGVALTHSPNGHISGSGWITVNIGDSSVAARYNATGQVSGGGNRPVRVQMSIHLSGNDVVAGVQTGFSISVRYNLTVDPGSMSLVGSAVGQASFSRLSGGRIDTQNFAMALPQGVDGTWSAQFDVVALNRLSGSGNFVLSDGRSIPVKLSGSYIPVSTLSKVRMNGVYMGVENDGRGSSVRMDFFPNASGPDVTLSGTVLGQKVLQ